MNYLKILLLVLIFSNCDTTSKWEVKGKYYEIVDGLHSEILTTWKNKSAFCEIYSTVLDHHNDTSFIVVLQTPRF